MARASSWHASRIAFIETARAISLGTDGSPLRYFERDWLSMNVIELDRELSIDAVRIAATHSLKSLDAIHLASALALPGEDLVFTTWDRQLHRAAEAVGLSLVPGAL